MAHYRGRGVTTDKITHALIYISTFGSLGPDAMENGYKNAKAANG